MKERPLLLSAPMVLAYFAGKKNQTRRIADQNPSVCDWEALYVREHHARIKGMKGMHQVHYFADGPMPTMEQRHDAGLLKSYPSIHMPRWASRITLPITGLRMERLRDITTEDARNEGLSCITKDGSLFKYGIPDRDRLPGTDDYGWPWHEWEADPVQAFRKLWEKIYGVGSWDKNPFVWVIGFPKFSKPRQGTIAHDTCTIAHNNAQ